MIVQRVERHLIKFNNPHYNMLYDFAHKSKNLYNHANYLIRQEFVTKNRWLRYNDLDKLLKADIDFENYRQMPTAQSAQQILRLLDKNWKSFFTAIKDWSTHPNKYLGKPKLPKYKAKNGIAVLILTNQEVKVKHNNLKFPKAFRGFQLQPQFLTKPNFRSFQQVRIIPKYRSFVVELVYNIEITDSAKVDNGRYLSVDIGLDNLATVVNNIGLKPLILNGKGLKSINKYFNKQISHYREVAKRMNNLDYTNKMYQITQRRNYRIDDYMHKASRFLVNYAATHNFNTIVIGNNKEWKQKSKMSRMVNQSFVGIPHMRFIEMVQYKAQELGIKVILTEESYTSSTSFIDNELPIKAFYNKSRRKYRGLFISNEGVKINADVNGAYQILKKVFPNAYTEGVLGVALHPVRVDVFAVQVQPYID